MRPGPIQGARRYPIRAGRDWKSGTCRHPRLRTVADAGAGAWADTRGVPLFQEQAKRIAIDAAKFTPEQGKPTSYDARWRRSGLGHDPTRFL